MQYFNKYVSNTLAGGSNQSYFINEGEKICRLYYKVFCEGTYKYSFLFSNTTDSTFPQGIKTYCNTPCKEWEIKYLKVGVCKEIGDEELFFPVAFEGKLRKTVKSGELFSTDEVELKVCKNYYICLEIAFSGEEIPCHYESLIPSFVLNEGSWIASKCVPLPSMIGCKRRVMKRIVFFGDSITQGIGTPENSYMHWNALLADKVGKEYSFWNLGIGFGSALDAATLGAWSYKAGHCDLAVVCFGVNDILQGHSFNETRENLLKTVKYFKNRKIKVLIQTIPPFDYDTTQKSVWEKLNEFISNELKLMCDGFFDTVPILGDENFPNKAKFGGHPNSQGCELWAKALLPEFERVLNQEEL